MTKTAEQDYQERLEEFSDRFLVDFFDGLVGTSDVVEFLEGRGIDRDDDLIADTVDAQEIMEAADRMQVVVDAYAFYGLTQNGRNDLALVLEAAYRYAEQRTCLK